MAVQAFGPAASEQIREMYGWYRRTVKGDVDRFTKGTSDRSKPLKFGRTTTNTEHSIYPSEPANTFVVQLGIPSFTLTPGNQTLSFAAYDPAEYRIAHDASGTFHVQNTVVLLEKIHSLWFIRGAVGAASKQRIGKLNNDLLKDDIGTITIWEQSGTGTFTPTTDEEDGINITGQTLKAGIFVSLRDTSRSDVPVLEVVEMKVC